MFPDGAKAVECYGSKVSSIEIADMVYNDMQDVQPLTKQEIEEELNSGYIYGAGFPKYPSYSSKHTLEQEKLLWDEYTKDCETAAKNLAKKLNSENQGKLSFSLSYSDNDGSLRSTIEHGDVFSNIPHQKVSKH
jgi:hypothetical protein